ncbi:MAG: IMPACT family protein [Acidobacteriota bacterium]
MTRQKTSTDAPVLSWLAPARPGRAEIRVKGSRFLADVARTMDEPTAVRHLERLAGEFPDATHHCWAFRVRDPAGRLVARCSDAGEPSNTAGAPIARALQSADLEESSLVVVRWFGGTKLGVGPLARAYRDAAAAGIDAAGIQRRAAYTEFSIDFPYEDSAAVRRALRRCDAEILGEQSAERAMLTVIVPVQATGQMEASVTDASRGRAIIQALRRRTGPCS